MIDACVKMECLGCHQLVPTVQFYEHLIDSEFDDNSHPLLDMNNTKLCQDNVSDFNNNTSAGISKQLNTFD